uniref:Phospholipid scramblase n=1 Tax=Fagus sylvatica TaxID=28930 RepID=A0A2N9GCM0_FAGSY
MNWTKGWRCLASTNKTVGRSESSYHTIKKNQNGAFTSKKVQVLQCLQSQSRFLPARSLSQDGLWGTDIGFQERLILARNVVWRFKLPGCLEGNAPWSKQRKTIVSRKYGHSVENDTHLDRDFLVQLWVADRKMKNSREKRRRKMVKYGQFSGTAYDNHRQFGRLYSGAPLTEQEFLDQPPLSQSVSGHLEPESPEEVQVAPLLARSNLLITRDIEWANLVLGFEQENRYAIVDVCYPQSVTVTLLVMAVQYRWQEAWWLQYSGGISTTEFEHLIGGIGEFSFGGDYGSQQTSSSVVTEKRVMVLEEPKSIFLCLHAGTIDTSLAFLQLILEIILCLNKNTRLLRLRRPFVAYITDAMGNELFRVRRPFWWITSSIYAEIDGKEVGVVHRRWHLWRRVYDLYLG